MTKTYPNGAFCMPNPPEKKQLPLLLQLAAERLDDLFRLADLTHGAGRCRAMRQERRDALRAVVSALLARVCLQADGLAVQLAADGREAVPLTVEGLAAVAGVGARRAKRVLYDMRDAGLIEVKPQWRRRQGAQVLLVAACLRRLTRKFWASLRLWGLYVETVRYMQGRPQIRIRAAVYEIAASLGRRVLPLLDDGRRAPPPPEAAAVQRQRETHNRAFACLVTQHGGTPCRCPSCSPDQLAACRRLAAAL